jgi:hypothetical protein
MGTSIMSYTYNTEKNDKNSCGIITTIIIGLVLIFFGLIAYGMSTVHWGTVVNKYEVKEYTVAEYDETLDTEITIIYPARYYIVIECNDGYYKCEVDEFRYVTSSVGKRLQIDSNIAKKIEGVENKNE